MPHDGEGRRLCSEAHGMPTPAALIEGAGVNSSTLCSCRSRLGEAGLRGAGTPVVRSGVSKSNSPHVPPGQMGLPGAASTRWPWG